MLITFVKFSVANRRSLRQPAVERRRHRAAADREIPRLLPLCCSTPKLSIVGGLREAAAARAALRLAFRPHFCAYNQRAHF